MHTYIVFRKHNFNIWFTMLYYGNEQQNMGYSQRPTATVWTYTTQQQASIAFSLYQAVEGP